MGRAEGIEDRGRAILHTRLDGFGRKELHDIHVALKHMALVRSIKIDAEVWIVRLQRAHHEPRQETPRAVGHILVVRVDGRIGRCVLENGNVRGAHPLR